MCYQGITKQHYIEMEGAMGVPSVPSIAYEASEIFVASKRDSSNSLYVSFPCTHHPKPKTPIPSLVPQQS